MKYIKAHSHSTMHTSTSEKLSGKGPSQDAFAH
jgi:hypothetical protein